MRDDSSVYIFSIKCNLNAHLALTEYFNNFLTLWITIQSKSDKFRHDIFTLRLITTLIRGPQLDNAKWLRLISLAVTSHCAQIQQKASRWLVSSTAQFHNLVTTSRLISVARWTKMPIRRVRLMSHLRQLTNWNFWTIWGEESTRQQPQRNTVLTDKQSLRLNETRLRLEAMHREINNLTGNALDKARA